MSFQDVGAVEHFQRLKNAKNILIQSVVVRVGMVADINGSGDPMKKAEVHAVIKSKDALTAACKRIWKAQPFAPWSKFCVILLCVFLRSRVIGAWADWSLWMQHP